jgi:hypothetical protein
MQGGGHMLDSSDKEYTVYEYELPAGSKLESPYTPVSDEEDLLFAGWAEKPGGEVLDQEYVPQADMTVYAVFNRKCTVCFDFNGGYLKDAGGDRLVSTTADYPENGAFSWNYAEIPNHENGTFSCWTLDAEGTQQLPADFRVTSDLTVYAQYEELKATGFSSDAVASVATFDDMEVVGAQETQPSQDEESVLHTASQDGTQSGEGTPDASTAGENPEEVSVEDAERSVDKDSAGSGEEAA